MLRSDTTPRVSNVTTNSGDGRIIPDMSGLVALFGTGTYSSHQIPEVRQILICCHAILILCGTTFNLAVLFALIYFKEQIFTNIANIFVFTLAASDVVLCGISMPIQLYYGIDENSRVNTALCRTLFAGFGIPMYVSCLTILLIAVDRYRLIVKPTAPRASIRTALCLILITVTFSALSAIPVGVYTESRGIEGFRNYCVEAWPKPIFRLIYSVATFILHFLLPLLVSGGLYLEIYRRLTVRPEQLSLSKESGRRKRRTTTLLACVVVCFVICWTPWCVFSLLVEIDAFVTKGSSAPHIQVNFSELTLEGCTAWLTDGALGDNQTKVPQKIYFSQSSSFIHITHFTLVDMVLKLWAMGSACINPFLYGWLNRPIRRAMTTVYVLSPRLCFRSMTQRSGCGNHEPEIFSRPSKVSSHSGCGKYPQAKRNLDQYYHRHGQKRTSLSQSSRKKEEIKYLGMECRCSI
ncbi:unnamed protein product [Hydatigera taeniaeformis]|uniref:G_PROTEIN_RECEP_F1_2 domain-containing protein n=1 Tax=Hydatigena taeniaeformis TaxID=6205 RepID=A0A0R3X2Y4_HYDTA|nr:unnamed protein product [Hydatigera taeniaeformis]